MKLGNIRILLYDRECVRGAWYVGVPKIVLKTRLFLGFPFIMFNGMMYQGLEKTWYDWLGAKEYLGELDE